MARFIIRGEVVPFGATQRNIRVQNVEALRAYWRTERIDTNLDWDRSEVLTTLSAHRFVSSCEPGDIVDYTIEPWDRSDGRRIRSVALEVVTPAGH